MILSGLRIGLALALLLTGLTVSAAPTGFSALQRSKSGESAIEQTAELSYGHHHLRVDHPGQRLLIDFETGALTVIDLGKKQYARVTLEEMVALRDKQLATIQAALDRAPPGSIPPEAKKQMEAQLAEAKSVANRSIEAKPTGEKDRVSGVACSVFAWSASDGRGKACIAKKLPFDASAFRKDSLRLSSRMRTLGAGSAASSMAILQLGKHGFPLKIEQTMSLGAQEVAITSTFENLRAAKHPKSHFAPPAGFEKRAFEAMMREAATVPPTMPPRPSAEPR